MYLSWELARAGTRVHVVEQDHDKCLRLSQDLPGAMIIEGDGTDNDMIRSENLFGTDGFVALTGRDEENLLMALAALFLLWWAWAGDWNNLSLLSL